MGIHAPASILPSLALIEGASVAAHTTGEFVIDNGLWADAQPRISVAIPTYKHDCSYLITLLAGLDSAGAAIEVVAFDDGSANAELLARMAAAGRAAQVPVRIVAAAKNQGRAIARNRAIANTRAEWILLLDADMAPDYPAFIETYLSAVTRLGKPGVIVGGYSLKTAPKEGRFALHRWQAKRSECLPAAKRAKAPGRFVFSSNVLVHRDVLKKCPFDEAFAGWGWEDIDWGFRCARLFPIVHIQNTATHLGLDEDKVLMGKYAKSGLNFALLTRWHAKAAETMPLFRAAATLRKWPKWRRVALRLISGSVARSRSLPVSIRGRALKVWRALVYAEAL